MAEKRRKILVTGGAGFIGSHLCEALLADGHSVICLDNFSTGSKNNLDYFKDNPDFQFVERDVTNPYHFEVEQIYNLACPASPVHYQKDPVKTVHTIVGGAIQALELAQKTGARVLQASTSEIYGDPLESPQKESYWGNVNPIGIRSCYDEGKRCAETLFFDYYRQSKVDIRVVRIFNTYGPRMAREDGRVVSNFIIQSLLGEDITIYGDGKHTRSFQYIGDLVGGFQAMMNQDHFVGPVNIGNPEEISINQLAERILALTGSKSKLIHKSLPQDDPKRRLPDITLAKEKLFWSPKVSLDEGVGETIKYFREVLN
jgi:UDP-glucuronate decarboxylase